MANIFIVNAAKEFAGSEGKLNDLLTQVAADYLSAAGHEVKITRIDEGYNAEDEAKKIVWSDVIIYQMPAWWMEGPWIVKKYVDEVFSAEDCALFKDDGRTRQDPTKKYGSGGLLQGKKYLFSVTWNAPLEAFTDPNQFFEGKGVDAVYFPFHKANQFLGLEPLATFGCFDVVKQPDIPNDIERYKAHLQQNIINILA